MNITDVTSETSVIKFELIGDISETITVSTQYGFQLTPDNPVHGMIFICYTESEFTFSNGGRLSFKCHVVTKSGLLSHRPSVIDLLALLNGCVTKINESLNLRASSTILSITAFDPAETLPKLEDCLNVAFPAN